MNVIRYYQDANFLTRFLVAARPLICPIGSISAWVPHGADILDIGCGVGLLSVHLATMLKPRRISGFDTNANAVAVANAAAKRVRDVIDTDISFSTAPTFSEWPTGLFGVVCMIDVAHHVPKGLWNTVYQSAAARVRAGGLLVYKDMPADPWWCGLGNRLHDLMIAQQWIHYCPLSFVRAALGAGMAPVHYDEWRKYWYMHQFTVFKKVPPARRNIFDGYITHRPLPSMLIMMPCHFKMAVKSLLVNWLPCPGTVDLVRGR